jgi:hypothetical protein
MLTKFLRILKIGFVGLLLFATIPGHSTFAQPTASEISTINGQSVDIQSSSGMNSQCGYVGQSTPLLPNTADNIAEVQIGDTSKKSSRASILEVPVDWTQPSTPVHPSSRNCHAMAYDSARGVVVLFGGNTLDDTWEWNGTDWVERSPANRPPARSHHAMAYDSTRGVVVLFGGAGTIGNLDDTWEWDGNDWIQRSPASHPVARQGHALAFDSVRGVVVLFGGSHDGLLADTWEWNGVNWVQRSSGNHPAARYEYAMAYDSAREVVVLYGGWDGWFSDDTWEWDGTDWLERSPATRPPTLARVSMVYDSVRGVVVLFGGEDYDYYYDNTWEWDGSNWQLRSPTNYPPARIEHAMAYDSAQEEVVIFGGDMGNSQLLGDTWLYAPLVPRPILSPIENLDGDGEYLIEWSTVSVAISYTLEEDDTASFLSPIVRYQGDQTGFQVLGQGSGEWYYRVKASNAQGDSLWSNVELTGVRPQAPILYPIANSDGNGTYLVDWSNATGATAYELQEDDNSAFTSPTVRYTGSDSQYQIDGQEGGTWYYRVLASNIGGNSPWSNTESVGVIPGTPYLLPINNPDLNGDYLIDWNNVSGALSYRLEEDDNSAFTSPIVSYEGDNSQYSVTGQQPGLWYYRVLASNTYGDSLWSNIESVNVIPASPILEPISNPDGNGEYLIDWNDVTGATSYYLEEDDNSSFTSPTARYNGVNSQYQVNGQPTGQWYYRVRASCAGGNSPWSNIESVNVAPEAPTLFTIGNIDGNGDYLVDWSDVTGATSYYLEEDDNYSFTSPAVRYTGIDSQFQVYGQETGTWYYRVLASNAYGNSPWSNFESVDVLSPTPTPTQTNTPTRTPTSIITSTPTPTATKTSTPTPSVTPPNRLNYLPITNRQKPPTPTPTQTPTRTPTSTNTPTPTQTKTIIPTPTKTRTPTSTPKVVVLSSNAFVPYEGSTFLFIVGEVRNNTSSNVIFVQISGTLRDADGNVVDSEYTYADIGILTPGMKSPFLMIFSDPPDWETYELVVTWDTTTDQPYPLQILNSTSYFDDYDAYHVVGEIKNQYGEERTFIKAFVTLYDINGMVIGVEYTYTNPSDLLPGETASFDTDVYFWKGKPDRDQVASYALQVIDD